MESDKNFQDLIKQYQILLENEKRRLTPDNFNSTEIDEKDKSESYPSEQDESQQIVKHNDSLEQPTNVVDKQGIAYDIPKETNHDNQKRAEMMEQWVTDSFYTSFPSFRKQDINTNTSADDRRDDYKKYLAEVSNKKLLNAVNGSRRTQDYTDSETVYSKPAENQAISARDKLLNDLKHSDLSYNFHSLDAIQNRNQKVATERTRRKVELQQELMRQIEEKRLGIERLRAKEKEEDEILQRRLENQMKALQMTDALTKKNTQKTSKPAKQTIRSRDPIPRRDLENNIDVSKSEDGSPENRIKSDGNANSDRQIYKFFTNSAPHNVNYYNHPVGLNNMSIVDPQLHHISTVHNQTQHCSHCRRLVPISCNTCCRNDFNPSYVRCYRCNLLQNMDCDNCRRAYVQSWNHNGDLERCGVDIYRENRPQILEITYQDQAKQSTSPLKNYRSTATQSDSPDISSYSMGNKTQHDNHYSPLTNSNKIVEMETTLSNVPDAVSLSKEHEMLELKRRNDILIAKFARNYGSLRKRKPVLKEANSQLIDDSFPLPLMREHLTTTSSRDIQKTLQNSQAVRKLEYKWEIPVVQKQVITNTPSVKVLTQIGAIAKQLQLEKLNFSND